MTDRSPFDEFVRASAHNLCADLLDKASGPPSDRDRARREDHAAHAIDALRRAIAGECCAAVGFGARSGVDENR